MEENVWMDYYATLEEAFERRDEHASELSSLFEREINQEKAEELRQVKGQIDAYHAAYTRCKPQKSRYLENRLRAVETLEDLFDQTAELGLQQIVGEFERRHSQFLELKDVEDIPVVERKRQELSELCRIYAGMRKISLFGGRALTNGGFEAYLSSLETAKEIDKEFGYILSLYLGTEWNDGNIRVLERLASKSRLKEFLSGKKEENLDAIIEKCRKINYFEGAIRAKVLKEELTHFIVIYNEAVLVRRELKETAKQFRNYLSEIASLFKEGITSKEISKLAEIKAETAKDYSEWAGVRYSEKELDEYNALAETLRKGAEEKIKARIAILDKRYSEIKAKHSNETDSELDAVDEMINLYNTFSKLTDIEQRIQDAENLKERIKTKNFTEQAKAQTTLKAEKETMPAYFTETGTFSLPVYLASLGHPENETLFFLRESLLRYDENGWTGVLEQFAKRVGRLGLAANVQDLMYIKNLAAGLKEFMTRGYLAQRINNFESTRLAAVNALEELGSYISNSERCLCAN